MAESASPSASFIDSAPSSLRPSGRSSGAAPDAGAARDSKGHFTQAFKLAALRYAAACGKSQRAAAIDMGISDKTLCNWVKDAQPESSRRRTPLKVDGDRESDIYELFCECESLGTNFVFRTCVDRRAEDGEQTVDEMMDEQCVKGVHRIEVMDDKGNPSIAVLEIKYHKMTVCPPIGKEKRYGNLELTVIHATERGTPKDRKPIEWKLITNLPVTCKADAIEKLAWYALRWKIEMFHKILKSGCRAEDSKLRTAERLANLIAMMCILAWRVLWLTMLNRVSGDLPPKMPINIDAAADQLAAELADFGSILDGKDFTIIHEMFGLLVHKMEADLGEDMAAITNDSLQDPKKICFGIRDEILVDLNLRERHSGRSGVAANAEKSKDESKASSGLIGHSESYTGIRWIGRELN